MRVAITGGRDREPTKEEMSQFWLFWMELHAEAVSTGQGEPVLVHGDCRGTDRYVAEHVAGEGFKVEAFPVDHEIDGPWPAAGPRRNRRMLESGTDALIQFLGGRGTADCVRQAKALRIPVYPVF